MLLKVSYQKLNSRGAGMLLELVAPYTLLLISSLNSESLSLSTTWNSIVLRIKFFQNENCVMDMLIHGRLCWIKDLS